MFGSLCARGIKEDTPAVVHSVHLCTLLPYFIYFKIHFVIFNNIGKYAQVCTIHLSR